MSIPKINYDQFIGHTVGCLKIFDICIINKTKYFRVQCSCSKKFHIECYKIKKQSCCYNCSHAYAPGTILDGIEVIKYLGKKLYTLKCRCGNMYNGKFQKTGYKRRGCGCDKNKIKEKHLINAMKLIGQRIGYLKITKVEKIKNSYILNLRCCCGKIIKRLNGHQHNLRSCGCKNFSLSAEKHPAARIKNCDALAIRELFSTGLYDSENISQIFNLDVRYVRKIIKKQSFKNI